MIERALPRGEALGLEPLEIRRRNLIPPEAFPYDTGIGYPGAGSVRYDSGNPAAVLDDVAARIDLPAFRAEQTRARATGRFLGLGVACYMEGTGAGTFEGATVRVEGSGAVTVASGLCSQGQGHETIIARRARRRSAYLSNASRSGWGTHRSSRTAAGRGGAVRGIRRLGGHRGGAACARPGDPGSGETARGRSRSTSAGATARRLSRVRRNGA